MQGGFTLCHPYCSHREAAMWQQDSEEEESRARGPHRVQEPRPGRDSQGKARGLILLSKECPGKMDKATDISMKCPVNIQSDTLVH